MAALTLVRELIGSNVDYLDILQNDVGTDTYNEVILPDLDTARIA
jgi:hypothetical protein